MTFPWMRFAQPTLSPETGSGEGDAPEGDAPPPDDGGKPEGEGDSGPGVERPEWFPESMWGDGTKFVNEDGELDRDKLGATLSESYQNASRKLHTRQDDLAKQLEEEKYGKSLEELETEIRDKVRAESLEGIPSKPEEYEFPESISIDKDHEVTIDKEHPLWGQLQQVAHKYSMPADAVKELAELHVRGMLDGQPDPDEEVAKLGDYGEDRVQRVEKWARANLSDKGYERLEGMAIDAGMIELLEELMEFAGEPGFRPDSDDVTGVPEAETASELRERLREMQNDPRYYKATDPSFVRKVRAGFKRLASMEGGGRP